MSHQGWCKSSGVEKFKEVWMVSHIVNFYIEKRVTCKNIS